MNHKNLVWWGTAPDSRWNWGDQLNPWLFSKIAGIPIEEINKIHLWDGKASPRYFMIGSILNYINSPNVEVWGTGLETNSLNLKYPPAKVCAVRGPLTRKKLIEQGYDCPEVYGDPALLLPKYYTPNVKKEYKYGIVQHFLHKEETEWISKYKDDPTVNIIDVENPSITGFIDEINKCEIILSSALHGIICGDAYGIPSYHINFDPTGNYNHFKFNDYYCSVKRPIVSPPLMIDKNVDIEDIWPPLYNYSISIDLDKLLEACPFKK